MKIYLLLTVIATILYSAATSQNVFNPSDPTVRYNQSRSYGSAERPDTNVLGLQKWVSTPTSGVSNGSPTWDASSYKAYFLNLKGTKISFRIKFPKTYTTDPSKKYPVMIFLHGAGEVACSDNNGLYNNEKQLQLGGRLFSDGVNSGKFDGFLVYPQLLARNGCWDAWGSSPLSKFTNVISMIDSLAKYARLDIDRVIMNGLSGGGYGDWYAASVMSQRITKIIPSSAAGSTTNRDAFVHIPIWFATGGKDSDPSPAQAAYVLDRLKQIGADIRYTQYPELGHAVWNNHWQEPDYFTYMNDTHKANPLVFFQKTDFCSGQAVSTKLGITAGFYAYEWQKDGTTIATKTGTTLTIVNNSVVSSYTGNDITVTAIGSYRVRFKRTISANWSDWSMKPALIKLIASAAPANNITVNGIKSKVLPSLDGSTVVPLILPSGFTGYQWVRVSDTAVVSTTQTYNAPIGVYKAKYDNATGCPFAYSPNFIVADAANGSPKPAPATNITATGLSLTSTRLNWSQGTGETGFEIYRATKAGGPYTLVIIAAANATSFTDNGLDPNLTYYYVIRAVNDTGGAATSNEASPDGGNTAPVIGTLSDMYVKSGSVASKDFTVTDNPGDAATVSLSVNPSFVTLSKISGNDYRLTINATQNDIGLTELEVVAKDIAGKTSTRKLNVIVADANIRSVFLNFGAAGKTAAAPWNNWLGVRAAGNVITNLKDESGIVSNFSVTTVNAWSTTTILGHLSGNNNGIFPDNVLESGIADNGVAKTIKISGLDLSKLYNLVFAGSQDEGLIATADYSTGTQVSSLDARYNINRTANLNSLVPDATGSIVVTITRTGGSLFTYLNGMAIEEYDPSITLQSPVNLYAEPTDRNTVFITWSDKTNNEEAPGGYELQRATDAGFTSGLQIISLPANTTSYTNAGLSSNTKYYYRVRAKNGAAFSGYSNVMATITPQTIVYVNFNTTIADGPSPWNNMSGSSVTSLTKSALKNQSGSSTAMALKLTKFFNGEFTAGRRTGNNSGIVPDNVLQSDYWVDKMQVAEFQLSGLSSTKRYRIGFFGSSSAAGWTKGNYTAQYSVNNRTVYLNSWENTTKVIYIGDLVPISGVLNLDFSTTAAAQFGFNGGIIIYEYSDSQGGVVTNSTLDTTGVNDIIPAVKEYSLRVHPNPFRDIINLDFYNVSGKQKITAEVFDLTGRKIASQDYNSLPEGHNVLRLTFNQRSNASLYLLTLKADGKIVSTIKLLRKN